MRTVVLLFLVLTTGGCGREVRAVGGALFGFFHDLCVAPESYDLGPGSHGVQGVRVNGAIAWIVPAGDGVVLIDTGFDEASAMLRRALGDQPVLGILLTHAHIDHMAGAAAFGEVPVYVHRLDRAALGDAAMTGNLWVELMEVPLGRPPLPPNLHVVEDGAAVQLGDRQFHARHTPGHTRGHTTWQVDELLFIGDALPMRQAQAGQLRFAHPPADRPDARGNLERLRALSPGEMLDGHNGRMADPLVAIAEALADLAPDSP